MKNYFIIVFIILIPFLGVQAQNYKIYKGDTINYSDENNNKQAYWIIFKNKTDQILQEGNYLLGKKEGLWKSYYINGNIKSEITYVNGEKIGEAKIYYENGNIAEEGTWEINKWVGKYSSYYQNGKLSYLWNYNETGNRSGYQQYFYENGKIKIEGQWNNGKENGLIKEYDETGALRLEKNFSSGSCDLITVKTNTEKIHPEKGEIEIKQDIKTSEKHSGDTIFIESNDTLVIFSGNGIHVFYNKEKQKEKEGEFLDGILISGKHYIYDDTGLLLKTEVYENGKIIEIVTNEKE